MRPLQNILIILVALFSFVSCGEKQSEGVVKFLLMSDTHIDDDFQERGHPVYTLWQPGDFAALEKTYEFINTDPYCSDIQFALFAGDQLNTGYSREQERLDAEMVIWERTLSKLDIYSRTKGQAQPDMKFRAPQSYVCAENLGKGQAPMTFQSPALDSRTIALQGNHDTGVPEFYRESSFQCGDVRFITFFASYCGLPAPPGQYRSTGKISDDAVAFVEKEMAAAYADKAINHIVLVSHWGIVADDPENFHLPIIDACPENGNCDNRKKILALAEKYGCDLYLNGHEHNGRYPVGRAGSMSDVNCGTVTGEEASWAIVEIHADKAVFNVYSRAAATEDETGLTYTRMPQLLRTFEVPLTALPRSRRLK